MKWLVLIGVLVIIGCGIPNSNKVDYEEEPECTGDNAQHFFGNFNSFMSIENFELEIKDNIDTIIIEENAKQGASDSKPPFYSYIINTPNYQTPNTTGKLRACFFNDRLWDLRYTPDNIEQFAKSHQLQLDSLKVKGITINCIHIGSLGNTIIWEDKRISKELRDWIFKHQ